MHSMASTNINVNPNLVNNCTNNAMTNSNSVAFKKDNKKNVSPEASTKVKVGTFFTTLAGVLIAMGVTFKHNSNPVKIREFNLKGLKDFVLGFKNIKYNEDKYDIEKLVGRLGIGSVSGGLAGGLLFDKKENRKAKLRESVIQLIGNIATPLLFVAGGGHLYKHFAAPKVNKLLKLEGKKLWKINLPEVPQVLVQTALLVVAIFAGNSVGNAINKKCFKVDDKRTIRLSDMSPHIDDACMSISLIKPESTIISRFIPAALLVAGNSIGTAQAPPLKSVPKNEHISDEKKLEQAKQV